MVDYSSPHVVPPTCPHLESPESLPEESSSSQQRGLRAVRHPRHRRGCPRLEGSGHIVVSLNLCRQAEKNVKEERQL